MDQIASDLQRKVSANRARSGFVGTGCPNRLTHSSDSLGPFHHHRHDWRAGDITDQPVKKGFSLVDSVVPTCQIVAHLQQLETHHLEPAALEAPENLPDQPPLDPIGFDHHKCAFHFV